MPPKDSFQENMFFNARKELYELTHQLTGLCTCAVRGFLRRLWSS